MDWLFKEDEYEPLKDRDKFIDKSIFSILNILSKIRRSGFHRGNSFIFKVNPEIKLLGTFLLAVLLSISRSFRFVAIVDGVILLSLFMLGIDEMRRVGTLLSFVVMVTFIMLIPSFAMGNIDNSLLLVLKVAGAAASVNLLSYSTKWSEVAKSLRMLFIPDIFIFVMDIAIRYIFLLGEISMEILYALKLKSIGRNNEKYSSISRIIGNLFIKSKEIGDEMYSAMECRGFTGEYGKTRAFKVSYRDGVYIGIIGTVIFMYFITNGM